MDHVPMLLDCNACRVGFRPMQLLHVRELEKEPLKFFVCLPLS